MRLTQAQYDELHARLETPGLSKRLQQRVQLVLDAAPEQIAFYRQVDVQMVRKWLEAYRAGGLAALADRPRSGHPSALRVDDWAALAALLEASAAGERPWPLRQLVDWLARERGVRISPDRLSRQLRARRFRWKRTKRSLQHKADPIQQEAKAADLGTVQAFAQAGALDLV